MSKQISRFLLIFQITIMFYFAMTTLMYFLSIFQGNGGVTLKLFGGGDDGAFYWDQISNILNGKPWVNTSIYPLIIALFIRIFKINSVFFVRFINFVIYVILTIFSMKIVKLQFKYSNQRQDRDAIIKGYIILSLLFMTYTSLVMITSMSILRDIWIYMLYIISVYFSSLILFFDKNKFGYLILLIMSLILLGFLRNYVLLAFLLSIVIFYFYRVLEYIKIEKIIIIVGILVFGVYYTFFKDFTIFHMSLSSALDYRFKFITMYPGGTQMMINLNQSNYIVFFINYFYSFLGNLLGPLPWQISNYSTLVLFIVESIPMFLIMRYLWLYRKLFSSLQKYILFHSLVWMFFIAITNDNLGTASRLRPVSWVLILIIFAYLYPTKKGLTDIQKRNHQ